MEDKASVYFKDTTTVWVTTQFTRLHCWPAAHGDVSFLSMLHRHVFHVKAEVGVTGLDRQVEFLGFKDSLTQFLRLTYESTTRVRRSYDTWSCEQLARDIAFWVTTHGAPDADPVIVTVSEDGENGATVTLRRSHAC